MSYNNLFHGGMTKGLTQVDNHTQWRIAAESLLADRNIWNPTAAKYFPLGAITESRDGRRWRYCQNGATPLTLALVNESSGVVTDWELKAVVPTTTVGTKVITLNVALGTALVSGDLIDGYMTMEDAAGEGHMYLIKDHTIGTTPTIYLADEGGIRTGTTTATTEITLTKNKYKDTVVVPSDPLGVRVGVNHVAVAATYFYWAQTRGPCPVIKDSTDTIIVGDMVSCGHNVDGTCCLMDIAADGDTLLGYCMSAPSASAETALIDLVLE